MKSVLIFLSGISQVFTPKMPELSIDVTVANRFISSLSKSLQALCHGCMEFDSGIEIVGYINVNIDSGSKVDYVLNEKVLKGTTNSMTFVSNSFLAKKESQKQTRENACSPIPQPQPVTPYASRVRGTPLGPQHHKAALQHPLHSQAHWGTQKRSWADDWRSPKRHRTQNLPAETQPFTDQNSQQSFPSSTSHAYPETGFKQPHMSSSTSDSENTDSTQQLLMSIKKEALEADNQNTTDTEQLASEHSPDDQAHDSAQDRMSNIQIKTDPDGANTQSGKATPTDSSNAAPSENTDFKGTFLEPSSKDPPGLAVEGDNLDTDAELSATFDQGLESASTKELALSDEVNVAGTSAANSTDDDVGESAESEPPSHAPIEYDQAADDGSYSQSAYEDAAEGSSDAGQFEVIEIDDEDEDVQAMFGDPRKYRFVVFLTEQLNNDLMPTGQSKGHVSKFKWDKQYVECQFLHKKSFLLFPLIPCNSTLFNPNFKMVLAKEISF